MSQAHRTSAWAKASRIARPRLRAEIESGNGWCFDGRHHLPPGSTFDVSHIRTVAAMTAAGLTEEEMHGQDNLTSSCRKHNRSAGGTAGAKISNRNTARKNGRIDEW
jgi:hypothetical protein